MRKKFRRSVPKWGKKKNKNRQKSRIKRLKWNENHPGKSLVLNKWHSTRFCVPLNVYFGYIWMHFLPFNNNSDVHWSLHCFSLSYLYALLKMCKEKFFPGRGISIKKYSISKKYNWWHFVFYTFIGAISQESIPQIDRVWIRYDYPLYCLLFTTLVPRRTFLSCNYNNNKTIKKPFSDNNAKLDQFWGRSV